MNGIHAAPDLQLDSVAGAGRVSSPYLTRRAWTCPKVRIVSTMGHNQALSISDVLDS